MRLEGTKGCWITDRLPLASPSSSQVGWSIHKSLLFLQVLNGFTSSHDALCEEMKEEESEGDERQTTGRGNKRRGTDKKGFEKAKFVNAPNLSNKDTVKNKGELGGGGEVFVKKKKSFSSNPLKTSSSSKNKENPVVDPS